MSTFFTSDTHFGHAAIINYCGRPFRDVEEMNDAMVARWNARVKPEDTVWHLGDFAIGKANQIPVHRSRLNGTILLVRGNHDRSTSRMADSGFIVCGGSAMRFTENGLTTYLRHHPPTDDSWRKDADFFLHGHVHEKYRRRGDCINVGVDVWGFEPVTLGELLAAEES